MTSTIALPRCSVDWSAFGLAEEPRCTETARFTVAEACVHEHVAQSVACHGCLAAMCQYGEPAEWLCDPCYVAGHECAAPLLIAEIAGSTP